MIRHLAVQVEDWPGLQRELRELRTRATALTEQLGSVTTAYDALIAERAQWADRRARSRRRRLRWPGLGAWWPSWRARESLHLAKSRAGWLP